MKLPSAGAIGASFVPAFEGLGRGAGFGVAATTEEEATRDGDGLRGRRRERDRELSAKKEVRKDKSDRKGGRT
jgi:hypothetical protein